MGIQMGIQIGDSKTALKMNPHYTQVERERCWLEYAKLNYS